MTSEDDTAEGERVARAGMPTNSNIISPPLVISHFPQITGPRTALDNTLKITCTGVQLQSLDEVAVSDNRGV